jgi:hypothetical protein
VLAGGGDIQRFAHGGVRADHVVRVERIELERRHERHAALTADDAAVAGLAAIERTEVAPIAAAEVGRVGVVRIHRRDAAVTTADRVPLARDRIDAAHRVVLMAGIDGAVRGDGNAPGHQREHAPVGVVGGA